MIGFPDGMMNCTFVGKFSSHLSKNFGFWIGKGRFLVTFDQRFNKILVNSAMDILLRH